LKYKICLEKLDFKRTSGEIKEKIRILAEINETQLGDVLDDSSFIPVFLIIETENVVHDIFLLIMNLNNFFLFITYFWICKMSKTICATSGAGTSYPTGTREFISVAVVFMKLNK
jgi:hypothetical protein